MGGLIVGRYPHTTLNWNNIKLYIFASIYIPWTRTSETENTHIYINIYIFIKYIYRPNKYIPCLKDEIPHVLWGSTKIRWLLNLAPVRCSLPASSTRSAWPGTIPLKLSRHRHLNSAKRNAYPHGQWIGLRENLNRRPWFLPSNIGFSCIFSIIQFYDIGFF